MGRRIKPMKVFGMWYRSAVSSIEAITVHWFRKMTDRISVEYGTVSELTVIRAKRGNNRHNQQPKAK
jgi:hypothetical protein